MAVRDALSSPGLGGSNGSGNGGQDLGQAANALNNAARQLDGSLSSTAQRMASDLRDLAGRVNSGGGNGAQEIAQRISDTLASSLRSVPPLSGGVSDQNSAIVSSLLPALESAARAGNDSEIVRRLDDLANRLSGSDRASVAGARDQYQSGIGDLGPLAGDERVAALRRALGSSGRDAL
jgi:hypothetical protein